MGFVGLISLALHLHNAHLFNTDLGFDGPDHRAYVNHLIEQKRVPLPHNGWEFYQPPVYYSLAAVSRLLTGSEQSINIIAFFGLSVIVSWMSWRQFRQWTLTLLALLAFLALPMLNIFPPMITNELLSALSVVIGLAFLLELVQSTNRREFSHWLARFTALISISFYIKYTALTLLPLLLVVGWIRRKDFPLSFLIRKIFLSFFIVFCLIFPVLFRNFVYYRNPLAMAQDFFVFKGDVVQRDWSFFTRLDWIWTKDIYTAHDYSFSGGLWNTFWHDGERVLTPVVPFHKKSFALWLLGFPLLCLSAYGHWRAWQTDRKREILLLSYTIIGTASLVQYNLILPYNFVLKSFYAAGLLVPYIWGLLHAARSQRWVSLCIFVLLGAQFGVLVSHFWIQPWWHVAKKL